MHLDVLPKELRLQIATELLVDQTNIELINIRGCSRPPRLTRAKAWQAVKLYPAILQANKQWNCEASHLLYSRNHFEFTEYEAPFSSFISQIGANISQIRYICIKFPGIFVNYHHNTSHINDRGIANLELIRDNCTGIASLELVLPPYQQFTSYCCLYDDLEEDEEKGGNSKDAASVMKQPERPAKSEALDLLTTNLKSISSLKDVIVRLKVAESEDISEDTEKIRDRGWVVKVARLPRQTWTSADGRRYFDTEEECDEYNRELERWQWQWDQEREKQEWYEERQHKRADPFYRRNSSFD